MGDMYSGGRGPATDTADWDAGAAMAACDTAACYEAIALETTTGEPDQRQHWALPHHRSPGMAANAAGVRAARARFNQTQNLVDREAARRHLFDVHRLPSEVEGATRLSDILGQLAERGFTTDD